MLNVVRSTKLKYLWGLWILRLRLRMTCSPQDDIKRKKGEHMDKTELEFGGFSTWLGLELTLQTKKRIEGKIPLHEGLYQPWGFLHGGVTIAFLESLASRGAELNTNLEIERPFGIDIHVRHRKSGKEGALYGFAELTKSENSKQYWTVCATDDEGDVVSEGTIITKIVSLERLAEKAREREARKK